MPTIFRRKKALEVAKDYFCTVLWPEKLKQILDEQKPKETKQCHLNNNVNLKYGFASKAILKLEQALLK